MSKELLALLERLEEANASNGEDVFILEELYELTTLSSSVSVDEVYEMLPPRFRDNFLDFLRSRAKLIDDGLRLSSDKTSPLEFERQLLRESRVWKEKVGSLEDLREDVVAPLPTDPRFFQKFRLPVPVATTAPIPFEAPFPANQANEPKKEIKIRLRFQLEVHRIFAILNRKLLRKLVKEVDRKLIAEGFSLARDW